ncbi:MAG: hypothetical protein Q4G23_08855, partial [Clostridia bacterium]|nr:hypothetical protein [Clostridia bacterium]
MTFSDFLKNRKGLVAIIASSAVVVALLAAVVSITFAKSGSDTILNGVTVGGIDLSGCTVDEAEELIVNRINEIKDEEITIQAGPDTLTATYADFGADYDCRLSAENAYKYGHEGFFSDIVPALKSTFGAESKQELSIYINNRVF